MPGSFYAGKNPRCPSKRRLDGPQSQSGRFGEEISRASIGNRAKVACVNVRDIKNREDRE